MIQYAVFSESKYVVAFSVKSSNGRIMGGYQLKRLFLAIHKYNLSLTSHSNCSLI